MVLQEMWLPFRPPERWTETRSAKTLFWAMLLLGIVMFIFGVTFMQLAYNQLRSSQGTDPSEIMIYYGTLGRFSARSFGMLVMYISIISAYGFDSVFIGYNNT